MAQTEEESQVELYLRKKKKPGTHARILGVRLSFQKKWDSRRIPLANHSEVNLQFTFFQMKKRSIQFSVIAFGN